jgi:hypothetical protein
VPPGQQRDDAIGFTELLYAQHDRIVTLKLTSHAGHESDCLVPV